MLGRFQGDLGNISSEIRALQEQSNGMGARLRGRRTVQARLAGFIAQMALPPALIHGIMAVRRGVGREDVKVLGCLSWHPEAFCNETPACSAS